MFFKHKNYSEYSLCSRFPLGSKRDKLWEWWYRKELANIRLTQRVSHLRNELRHALLSKRALCIKIAELQPEHSTLRKQNEH